MGRFDPAAGRLPELYATVRARLARFIPETRLVCDALRVLAALCSAQVVEVPEVQCCGFAGDKGFVQPELNAWALRGLRAALPAGCAQGYSSSRTCEIGLSDHAGIPYRSIVHLVDACATPIGGVAPATL